MAEDNEIPGGREPSTDPTPLTGRARSLANLAPQFPKGKTGNPKGSSKKQRLNSELFRQLSVRCPEEWLAQGQLPAGSEKVLGKRPRIESLVAHAVIRHALSGNPIALRILFEYTQGKPQSRAPEPDDALTLEGLVISANDLD